MSFSFWYIDFWLNLLLSILLFLMHGSGDQCWEKGWRCTGAQMLGLAAGEPSGASDRRQGQIQAHKQLQRPWLSVCTSTAIGCCHRCTHANEGWWWVSGPQCASAQLEGLALRAHTVVWVSCGGSRFAPCTPTATEAWAGCLCKFRARVGAGWREWGGTRMANVSRGKELWGKSPVKSVGGLWRVCWPLVSLVEKAGVIYRAGQWEPP